MFKYLSVAVLTLLIGAILINSQSRPQFGTGTIDLPNGQGNLVVPAGHYVYLENYTPTYTPTDWANYPFCTFNAQTGFQTTPCYFLFPDQGKRWVVFRYCASGQRPGTPAQCWCQNGLAGNSGKCK